MTHDLHEPHPSKAPRASPDDAARIQARYRARDALHARDDGGARPEVTHWLDERRRVVDAMLHAQGWTDRTQRRVVEVGCGAGGNLAMLVSLGFDPARMVGVDLMPERIEAARASLPAAVALHVGDARMWVAPAGSVDLVLQFTVLSSLLTQSARSALAQQAWGWLRPGGALLSYDFVLPSPGNRDVRALTERELRALFPQGVVTQSRRVTLAPPIARALARVHPAWLDGAARMPWLRTHRMVWIHKPAAA